MCFGALYDCNRIIQGAKAVIPVDSVVVALRSESKFMALLREKEMEK
jgi:hypothetical protein